jgi:hypothetical protein
MRNSEMKRSGNNPAAVVTAARHPRGHFFTRK